MDAVSGCRWEKIVEHRDENDEPSPMIGWEIRGQIRDDDSGDVLDTLEFDMISDFEFFWGWTPTTPYTGVYDVEGVPPGQDPVYLFGGRVRVRPGVTQP